jgi:Lrp/AsnC family transcriptional regulator for asnA, asnC and gidA
MAQLDNVEWRLVSELQENARQTNTELAAKIGMTEGSIRRRIAKLLAGGFFKIVAVVDPELFGLTTHAVIGLKVEATRTREIAAAVADMPELSYVYETTGQFDIIVVGFFTSTEEMRDFLQQKLVQRPGIISTDTFLVMRTVKRSLRWGKVREAPDLGPPRGKT